MAAPRICSVEDCNKPSRTLGLCSTHYARHQRSRTTGPKCTVEGCPSSVYGQGFCSKHYQRWVRNGDPTAGRTDEGAPLAWIESALRYDGDDCLAWPYATTDGGYGVVRYGERNAIVSRVICEREHGPAPLPDSDAAHSCNFRLCGNKRHVSWKTRSGNMADAIDAGTWLHGEAHPSALLTEDDVKEIRRLRGEVLQTDLADRYGVHRSTISAVQNRVSWDWLD